MRFLPFPILTAFLATSVIAATPIEMLEQLRAELRTELKSALDKGNGENNQRLFQIESLLVEQLPARELPEDQLTQIVQTLAQIRLLTRAPKAGDLCEKLITELRTLTSAWNERFKETFNSTIKETLHTGLKATEPREVDAPLLALANLQKQVSRTERYNNSGRGVDMQQLSSVISVLTLWQDAMMPRGGAQRGRNSAEQIESMAQSYSHSLANLIPRSEFMALVNSARLRLDPAPTRKPLSYSELNRQSLEILRGVNKLGEIDSAVKTMDELAAHPESNSANNSPAAQTLKRMRKFHEDMKAGMAVSLSSLDSNSNSSDVEEAATIKGLIIKFALPRVLHVTGDAAPKEDENVSAYFQRLIEESNKNSDWPLLARVLDTAQSLKLNSIVPANDSTALKMMLAAINQERARQFSGAVAFYLAALRTGSQVVSAELIGEKLDAIRNAHFPEYEAGESFQISDDTIRRMSGLPYTGITPYSSIGPRSVSATLPIYLNRTPATSKAAAVTKPAPAAEEKKTAESKETPALKPTPTPVEENKTLEPKN